MNWTKKKIGIIVAIILCVGIIIFAFFNIKVEKIGDDNNSSEIVPEEEISDIQLRETTINLYYVNENNEITSEIRKIDSKELLENPYYESIKILIDGPVSENIRSCIPENTNINSVTKSGDLLIIDFTKDFIENQSDIVEEEGLAISQIVDTVTQFTEINSVKINIDGNENCVSKTGSIRYEQIFTKED